MSPVFWFCLVHHFQSGPEVRVQRSRAEIVHRLNTAQPHACEHSKRLRIGVLTRLFDHDGRESHLTVLSST